MDQDLGDVVRNLIPLLDDLRRTWFRRILERYSETRAILHTEFTPDIDLGLSEDELPSSFPFNRFTGETAEALIVNWQLQVAINFTTQHKYIGDEQFQEFVEFLMKHGAEEGAWLRAFGSFFSSEPLQSEQAALHLAQYFLGIVDESDQVQEFASDLHGFLYVLSLATQAEVARSFGDHEEVGRCTAAIGELPTEEIRPATEKKSETKPGCFIATAVYGDPEAADVRLLRLFRDSVLINWAIGRAFVGTYYRTAPYIASILLRSAALRFLCRTALLAPLARMVSNLVLARTTLVAVVHADSPSDTESWSTQQEGQALNWRGRRNIPRRSRAVQRIVTVAQMKGWRSETERK